MSQVGVRSLIASVLSFILSLGSCWIARTSNHRERRNWRQMLAQNKRLHLVITTIRCGVIVHA